MVPINISMQTMWPSAFLDPGSPLAVPSILSSSPQYHSPTPHVPGSVWTQSDNSECFLPQIVMPNIIINLTIKPGTFLAMLQVACFGKYLSFMGNYNGLHNPLYHVIKVHTSSAIPFCNPVFIFYSNLRFHINKTL